MSKNFLKVGFGLLVGGLLAGAALPAAALPAGIPEKSAGGLRGEAAITALGTNLNAVAAQYRRTPDALRALLRSDSSLRLNAARKLFYVCEGLALPPSLATNNAAAAVAQPIFPLSQTFLLHSKRGSARTIYLDFDGHTISGTSWNDDFNGGKDIVAPPWDIDGNPAVFGAVEQASIQEIWFRVAEDYAPFDVDVTTEYPGEDAMLRSDLSDQIYGTRALISPIAAKIVQAGGVAYLGAFNEVGNFHKPALIFPENLGNDPKAIAEATSHEVGHNLDLQHDGTTRGVEYYEGQGNWAPIMGVGYYRPIVQWSKGEYANANNLQDDLAVITSTGLDYRTNDFGNSIATATLLRGVNPTTNGIIARTGEVDYLALPTGAGTATINLTMTEFSGNLHARVTVYDSAGVMITNRESVDDSLIGMTGVSLSLPVAASQYYIAITGVGVGDPVTDGYSSYASLGQYTLSVTAPPGAGAFGITPKQPYGTNLAVLNGGNPNGYWALYVHDIALVDSGVISNGWALTLTSGDRVGAAADVAVYTSASPGTVSVGSNLVFTVSVTNYGPSISSNIVVADALPFGAGMLVASNLTQGTLAQNGVGLTWNVGTLGTNAGARLNFTVRPAFVGNIFNSVSVTAGTTDPNPDDDTAEVGVNVVTFVPPPQLTGITIPNPGFIQFSVTNGSSPVIIQSSTNLVNWVNRYTNTPPFTLQAPTTNPPVQFFRALLAP